MAKYIIFGGSGFLGEKLIERLVHEELTVVARNEGKLIALKEKFPNINIIPGDIADSWTVAEAFKTKPDGVFLLSASKSVEIAEKEVMQCVKSNVIGTLKILKASLIYKPKFIILTSTDKAAQVSGVYGATKLLCERLFKEAQELNPDTKYRVVRYGNVWGSTASFITKWIPLLKQGNGIKLTDPDMTRFFWTRDDAISLIFSCLEEANGPEPYIPSMKAMRMGDIVDALKIEFGDFKVDIIGNRGAENIHETMDGKTYSNDVDRYSVKEILEKFIRPML